MAPTPKAPAQPELASLADALFSKTQQHVLGALFGNPTRSFYAKQIVDLAGSANAQRELSRLEASGVVTVTHVGKEKRYQANSASPVFAELHALAIKTCGLTDILRDALKPLAASISGAFIYGPFAKGQDSAARSIDVIVISDTVTDPALLAALEGAIAQLGRKVVPTIYTTKGFADRVRRQNSYLKRLLLQPKLWLIGSDQVLPA